MVDAKMLIYCRISRLEQTVSALVERLEANDVSRWPSSDAALPRAHSTPQPESYAPPQTSRQSTSLAGPSAAPVLVIRDVATEIGVSPEAQRTVQSPDTEVSHDIIANGLLSLQDASSLVVLYVIPIS